VEIFCGVDWAEAHHDIAIIDGDGRQLVKRRIADDLAGFGGLCALLAEHTGSEGFVPVDVGIETDRGLLVAALRAAGHVVVPINPKAVSRYRDRHAVSGAKSDPGDALVLAQIMRTDRPAHRVLPDDSEEVAALRRDLSAEEDFWEVASMAANLHVFTIDELGALARDAGFADVRLHTADLVSTLVLTASYVTYGRRPGLAARVPWRRFEELAGVADRAVCDRLVPPRLRHTVDGVLRR
jgi:hypothetical protein